VLESLGDLRRCIDLMPCSGPLFTSQSPFFAVFILAVTAYREEDRGSARTWFEAVLGGASCRSVCRVVLMLHPAVARHLC
jgi:hypothetical protein